jgi:hypothetical protein
MNGLLVARGMLNVGKVSEGNEDMFLETKRKRILVISWQKLSGAVPCSHRGHFGK